MLHSWPAVYQSEAFTPTEDARHLLEVQKLRAVTCLRESEDTNMGDVC